MTDLDRLGEYRLPRFSWDYEHLPPADHWFLLARAYAESSVALFQRMIRDEVDDSFHHAKVAALLLEHAVELFLKAILALHNRPIQTTHKTDRLLSAVRAIVPPDLLSFTAQIDEAVRQQHEAPASLYFRYPSDQRGEPWSGHTHFELTVWYQQASLLRDDFVRLESEIKAALRDQASDVVPPDV